MVDKNSRTLTVSWSQSFKSHSSDLGLVCIRGKHNKVETLLWAIWKGQSENSIQESRGWEKGFSDSNSSKPARAKFWVSWMGAATYLHTYILVNVIFGAYRPPTKATFVCHVVRGQGVQIGLVQATFGFQSWSSTLNRLSVEVYKRSNITGSKPIFCPPRLRTYELTVHVQQGVE